MHRTRWVIATLAVLALAGAAWWFFVRNADDTEAARLVTLNNVGLGHLENQRAADSIAAFEQIVHLRPNDPLGVRNLAIARLVALEQTNAINDPEALDAAIAAARKAVAQLKQVEPEAATTHVLAARVAVQADDLAAAQVALVQATELAPDDAANWYELYKVSARAEADEQAAAALRQAYRLEPQNLFVLLDWLAIQVDRKDGTIVQTLTDAMTALKPVAVSVDRRARVDMLDMLANARTAAEQGRWNEVQGLVRGVVNVTRPDEAAQSDLLQVDRNVLEFVVYDFPPKFYSDHDLERTPSGEEIPVEFVPLELGILDKISDARDVRLVDVDLDERPDVLTLREGALEVYSRTDSGWQQRLRQEVAADFQMVSWADLDSDADRTQTGPNIPCRPADGDIVLTGPQGVAILENHWQDGQRVLVPRAEVAAEGVRAAALVDFDHDGDLDLTLSTSTGMRLLAQRGPWQFEDVSDRSVLPSETFQPTLLLPVDWDRDVDLDVLLFGGDGSPNGLLENLRHGRLRWRAFDDGDTPPAVRTAKTAVLLDADANASWDLLVASPEGLTLVMTRTPTAGRVVWQDSRTISDFPADQLRMADYDNDGRLDVLAWNADAMQLLRDAGGGRFVLTELLDRVPVPVAADFGDADGDGDLDLLLAGREGLHLQENRGGHANGWIDVALVAQQVQGSEASASGRVNQFGIGSLLELKNGPAYQARVVTGPVTHFGLGQQTAADVLRVVWTNGIPQNVLRPQARAFVCEEQKLKGSCPYLYTWDGERFVFVTDLLWAAPIGLQTATGELAPSRPWEYLKIRDDQLKAQNGQYRIQLTEELWEAAYFDQVELLTVDHPAGTEVYSNEKVGPPEIAEFHIHTVRRPRRPVAATDSHGRNVLATIAAEDGRYLRAFDWKHCQGYTEPHWLELDLGDLSGARRIVLFLTGWVYPTDTSINVQLAQDATRPGPQPPSLLVPDGHGNWQEVRPFIGFPGGKTKTIAVDLSGAFLTEDYRLRIATSMELYWDAVFFTVDEQPAETRVQTAPLLSADLHWRGISTRVPQPHHAPEHFDYDRVITRAVWPPMRGAFTRYGDVAELVRAADDRSVVMGSGDELTLCFARPDTEPPPGWTRDFLLHSVGWDKDADLNTVTGQTVEPLPFRAMPNYPYEPHASFPDTPQHRTYLKQYQTRTMEGSWPSR